MKLLGWTMLALILLAAGAAAGILGMPYWHRFVDEKPGPTKGGTTAEVKPPPPRALGRTEPAGGIIAVGVAVPDRIASLSEGAHKGKKVDAGDPLVVLESRHDRQSEYDLLDVQCKEADAKYALIEELGKKKIALEALRLKQLDAMAPIQDRLQKAKVEQLKKQLAAAQENKKRLAHLGSGSVSQQEKEQQELLVSQAESELQAAIDLDEQRRMETKLERGLVNAKIEAAQAELNKSLMDLPRDQLRRQREVAKRKLDETTLRAPMGGTILRVYGSVGEVVGGGQPILEMADLSKMAVVAEVYETERSRIHVGQAVDVTNKRVWGEATLAGVVDNIGKQIAKNRIFDADPTANVDRRVFEVHILLKEPRPRNNPDLMLIHMQVDVSFKDDAKGGR
jgi:HlyD family secretion protein